MISVALLSTVVVVSAGCTDGDGDATVSGRGGRSDASTASVALGQACNTSRDCMLTADGGSYWCLGGQCVVAEKWPAAPESNCPADVDSALQAAHVDVEPRKDCGLYTALQFDELSGAQSCFEDARDGGDPVQWSSNACVDCLILSTYVATTDGQLYFVKQLSGPLSSTVSSVTVESCDQVLLDPEPNCVGKELLFECS
jgi:hypothetical protein